MEDAATYNIASQHDMIRFQRNYNNKLNCDYFTSIRLNAEKYQPGKTLKVFLHQNGLYRDMGFAKILEVRVIRIHQINDWMARLDTGLDSAKTKDMIWYMYKDRIPDIEKAEFVFLLLEKVKNSEKQAQLFG